MLARDLDMAALARRVGEPMRGLRAVTAREGEDEEGAAANGPRLANRARQDDGEGRPGVGGRLEKGLAAVGVCDLAHDVEAKPDAA